MEYKKESTGLMGAIGSFLESREDPTYRSLKERLKKVDSKIEGMGTDFWGKIRPKDTLVYDMKVFSELTKLMHDRERNNYRADGPLAKKISKRVDRATDKLEGLIDIEIGVINDLECEVERSCGAPCYDDDRSFNTPVEHIYRFNRMVSRELSPTSLQRYDENIAKKLEPVGNKVFKRIVKYGLDGIAERYSDHAHLIEGSRWSATILSDFLNERKDKELDTITGSSSLLSYSIAKELVSMYDSFVKEDSKKKFYETMKSAIPSKHRFNNSTKKLFDRVRNELVEKGEDIPPSDLDY